MRYLTAITTPSLLGQVEECLGSGRIRPLRDDESAESLGPERFAALIVDRFAPLSHSSSGLPVLLAMRVDRPGMQRFRTMVEAGADVRIWRFDEVLSEPSIQALGAPRAPTPAAAILAETKGLYDGLVAEIVTAAAILSDERRCMEEIARACEVTPTAVRGALRDHGLVPISGILARMRCLHALWALESGRATFWSAAGFRTLAEVSEFLSRNTGSPLGRWRVPGGFATLVRGIGDSLRIEDDQRVGTA